MLVSFSEHRGYLEHQIHTAIIPRQSHHPASARRGPRSPARQRLAATLSVLPSSKWSGRWCFPRLASHRNSTFEISHVALHHTAVLCPHPNPGVELIQWQHRQFYLTLLIQQVQNAQLSFYEVDTRLVIIKINQGPRDLLLHVLFLLQFEDMLG